ncbi:hypothetical protein JXB41_05290 [Candidatus Woesearchaeota archaeon]|nr:hypothetical protein [Candidatus Woesearchaeota archaeon]
MTKILTKYDKNQLFNEFLEFLNQKIETRENFIPLSVFSKRITPFETLVKYMHENLNLNYSEIGNSLKKDRQVIWTTYKRALKKHPKGFKEIYSKNNIPLQELSSAVFSVSELIVTYLKDTLKMKNSDIAHAIKRDERTIWTWYARVQKKKNAKK